MESFTVHLCKTEEKRCYGKNIQLLSLNPLKYSLSEIAKVVEELNEEFVKIV